MKRILVGLLLALLGIPISSNASGKKPATPTSAFSGRKAVEIKQVPEATIEMPDQTTHDYGEELFAVLATKLTQSGKYFVVTEERHKSEMRLEQVPDYRWTGTVAPSATLSLKITELSFRSGAKGDQMFYGFDDRVSYVSLNSKQELLRNEFPLKETTNGTNWFGHIFDGKGTAPFDSRSGLDLGDGFSINFLFAWMHIKYASYRSSVHLEININNSLLNINKTKILHSSGKGFFFDVAGAYEGYSAAIRVARRDAMDQAIREVIEGTYDSIQKELEPLPLLAKVDAILSDGNVLLGTGPLSDLKIGTQYATTDGTNITLEVVGTSPDGAIGRVVSGNTNLLKLGCLLQENGPNKVQLTPNGSPLILAETVDTPEQETTTLPAKNLKPSNLDTLVPHISEGDALLKSLTDSIFLIYRIVRYFMYDQSYHKLADGGATSPSTFNYKTTSWGKRIGLPSFTSNLTEPYYRPIIAVVDSGIDYNHPAIHNYLWLNPIPQKDMSGHQDRYGWDFISNDSRPYDDGYHGTQVASIITNISPNIQLMPLKVFNPWGITNSSSLYSAFKYAVDHDASIILCSWATDVKSEAIRLGVEYAAQHGVLVVAAAGDQGKNLANFPFYPASYSRIFDNVVAVSGVDENDRLIKTQYGASNFDPGTIQLAAPGKGILVAEPRMGQAVETSTGLSAAIVAGVAAQLFSGELRTYSTYKKVISKLFGNSKQIDSLKGSVQYGLRLQF